MALTAHEIACADGALDWYLDRRAQILSMNANALALWMDKRGVPPLDEHASNIERCLIEARDDLNMLLPVALLEPAPAKVCGCSRCAPIEVQS